MSTAAPVMPDAPSRHPLQVDDVVRMMAAGILDAQARVELIEGELIDMAPINAPHSGVVARLIRLFSRAVGDRALVYSQSALRLDVLNVPQPDLALLRPVAHDYTERLPAPADVLLLIEVSDSSLRYDRDTKLPLYATHGIPEVWIVDLQNRQIERHRDPEVGVGYRSTDRLENEAVPMMLPECAVNLAGLLPA